MPDAQTTPARFEQNEVYYATIDGAGTKYAFQVVTLADTNGFMVIKDSNGLHTVQQYTRPQTQAATIHGGLHGHDGVTRFAWADLPASEVFGPQWVEGFLQTLA
jgi:hypothetical protein